MLASTPYKQAEYMAVVLFTLLSRTAVEGGMSREQSYSLSDVYIQKLAQCHSAQEIMNLCAHAQRDYTERVHAARHADSQVQHVELCKQYIADNLRRSF